MDGVSRQHLVRIGDKERPIQEARFVPPPADDRLHSGIAAWEQWVQAEYSHLTPVVRAAMAYCSRLSTPFGDFARRPGRLAVVPPFVQIIQQPAITLSPWLAN